MKIPQDNSKKFTIYDGLKYRSDRGLTFLVSRSNEAMISLDKLRPLLDMVASRLFNAPYYSFIKVKTLNIQVVAEAEFEKKEYYTEGKDSSSIYDAPEIKSRKYLAGVYDMNSDTVLINIQALNNPDASIETILHECLHALSAEVGENGKVRMGLMTFSHGDKDKYALHEEGRYLNEGLTEYLRINTGRQKNGLINTYQPIQSAIAILADRIGEMVLWDAYFNGNIEGLKKAIDALHGIDAYSKFSELVEHMADPNCMYTLERELRNFVIYGFECDTMQQWGYSPEDRTNSPRIVTLDYLPVAIRGAIKVNNIRAYTNLTSEELQIFFLNFPNREKHLFEQLPSYYDDPNFLSVLLAWLIEDNPDSQAFIFIKRGHDIKGTKMAKVSVNFIDLKYLQLPNFLGRTKKLVEALFGVSI